MRMQLLPLNKHLLTKNDRQIKHTQLPGGDPPPQNYVMKKPLYSIAWLEFFLGTKSRNHGREYPIHNQWLYLLWLLYL